MVRGVGFGWARTLRRGRRAKITPGGENADDIVLGSLAPWLLGSLAPWLLGSFVSISEKKGESGDD